eukprot:COSAG04_NODE_3917_length_2424_cov_139.574194_5_plen_69_part_01
MHPAPPPRTPRSVMHSLTSVMVAGYSTLAGGDCDASPSPSPSASCSWRIRKVVNTMNASCVNGFLHKAV